MGDIESMEIRLTFLTCSKARVASSDIAIVMDSRWQRADGRWQMTGRMNFYQFPPNGIEAPTTPLKSQTVCTHE
jgi:hypothetical protein